jgi:hypothetical protein
VVTADIARERPSASTYVAMLRAGFRVACRVSECVQRDLVIAGRGVRLRFAGPALVEPMSRALAHLESRTPSAHPAMTGLLWDASSTGVPLPPVPWTVSDLDDHGQSRGYRVRGWDGERVYTLYDQDYGAITLFDVDARTAIYATLDAQAVPAYERAAPLRAALHWSLSEPGRHLVHAGAVGGSAGAVLVAGRSGSGKSTLTLSCVEAGLGYVGDDYVLIEMDGGPTAHAVHATAKLSPEGAGWLPTLSRAILARDFVDGGKAVLDLHRHRPASLLPSAPVRAVVLPRVLPGVRTHVRAASAAEGVRAVAPSTVLQHFGHGPAGMATVAELMRAVPVYVIELGRDMARAVDAVERLARGSGP